MQGVLASSREHLVKSALLRQPESKQRHEELSASIGLNSGHYYQLNLIIYLIDWLASLFYLFICKVNHQSAMKWNEIAPIYSFTL